MTRDENANDDDDDDNNNNNFPRLYCCIKHL